MSPSSQWLCGRAEVTVTGIQPVAFLNRCTQHGIPFEQPEPLDECTLRLYLPNRLTGEAASVASRCGCTLEVIRRSGGQPMLRRLRRRMALAIGGVGVLLVLFVSSLFIWDIQVVDNDADLSDGEILHVLEEVGVGIGTFWPGQSSDMIRSAALTRLPELCWLTVNVHGSQAQVMVRPAVEIPELLDEGQCIQLVAERSGILESIHVLEGETQLQPGDAVLAGDVLVSGLRPGGLDNLRTVRAQGEIIARTWYELTARTPLKQEKKTNPGRKNTRFAMILGKRRINFYFDSGFLEGTCDKITRIRPLELKGVFSLPLALVTETEIPWATAVSSVPEWELAPVMEQQLTAQLRRQLGEKGQIVTQRFDSAVVDDMLVVTLRAECLQSIAREETYTVPVYTNEPVEDTVWKEPSQWIGSRTS